MVLIFFFSCLSTIQVKAQDFKQRDTVILGFGVVTVTVMATIIWVSLKKSKSKKEISIESNEKIFTTPIHSFYPDLDTRKIHLGSREFPK